MLQHGHLANGLLVLSGLRKLPGLQILDSSPMLKEDRTLRYYANVKIK